MGSHSLTALERPFVGTDFHGHISGFLFQFLEKKKKMKVLAHLGKISE